MVGVKVRKVAEPTGIAWKTAVGVVKPVLLVATKHEWIDGERIPASGGCVVAMNHVSHVDPLTLAWLLYEHGRVARYLAKDALFEVPVVRWVLRGTGQIPVVRQSADAALAFEAACAAVRDGAAVCVYPEGTISKDPTGWPMRGKTGAARIALETGCPVIPIGQWGAQDILPPYRIRPRLIPRQTARYRVGEPVDLDDLRGRPLDAAVLAEATGRIMAAITALVAELRGEEPPDRLFDPAEAGISPIGRSGRHHDQKRSTTRHHKGTPS